MKSSKEKEFWTMTRISRHAQKTIMKYADIHHMSLSAFFEKLANLLNVGIDGLETLDLAQLRKMYPYSDIFVAQDVRKIFAVVPKEVKK